MSEAEVERLPDPDLFRDALWLHASGTWSPDQLDEADALLLAIIGRFRNAKKGKES